jgi:hypothetical protein
MVLREIIVTQLVDIVQVHVLPIAPVSRSVKNSLSVLVFMKNYYLEELLETRILYFFNIGRYSVMTGLKLHGASSYIMTSDSDLLATCWENPDLLQRS